MASMMMSADSVTWPRSTLPEMRENTKSTWASAVACVINSFATCADTTARASVVVSGSGWCVGGVRSVLYTAFSARPACKRGPSDWCTFGGVCVQIVKLASGTWRFSSPLCPRLVQKPGQN